MKTMQFLYFTIFLVFLFSCQGTQQTPANDKESGNAMASSGPDAIIYKTKADYNTLVPVILNEEKSEIRSYPAPGDLKYKGKPAIPIVLADGFLLDNRGINENVAFLNITYDDYMALQETPSSAELFDMILDDDPLTEMYNCGKRRIYDEDPEKLNKIILNADLGNFTRLK